MMLRGVRDNSRLLRMLVALQSGRSSSRSRPVAKMEGLGCVEDGCRLMDDGRERRGPSWDQVDELEVGKDRKE